MALENQIHNLLLRFNPSETALLDWLGPRIDDSHLHEIANADYGVFETEYFQALKFIHEGQPIPVPLHWIPKEALELMRWSEPDDPQYLSPPPNSKGTRGHLIRAFCCAVLLKAADEPETLDYILSENDTLIQLIASVLHLGTEASESALRFLCWRTLRMPQDYEEYPFFAMSILLLRTVLLQPGQDGTELSLLADWVITEEKRIRMEPTACPKSEDWLLGLTFHDLRHEVWRRVTQEVLLDSSKGFPDPAATALREIGKRLVPKPG